MTTPSSSREIAERIIYDLDIQDTRSNQIDWIESMIERAVWEARNEAVKFHDGLNETSREVDRKVVHRMLKEARSAALEQAAKIADADTQGKVCGAPGHDDRWCSSCNCMHDEADALAAKIRALQEPGE